ncbi:MAG: DUF5317 domain-containing protein [Chloroflexi bacterium]|nr:DUF5317 domain-containing protein [Chloroflexota bacterium]
MRTLPGLRIRFGWIIVISFTIYLRGVYFVPANDETLRSIVILSSMTILAFGVLFNLHLWAFRFMAIGLLLNLLVMASNGGFMPISPETLKEIGVEQDAQVLEMGKVREHPKVILLPVEQTRMPLLSDTLIIPGVRNAYSPGDFFVMAGVLGFIFELSASLWSTRKHSKVERGEEMRNATGDIISERGHCTVGESYGSE